MGAVLGYIQGQVLEAGYSKSLNAIVYVARGIIASIKICNES